MKAGHRMDIDVTEIIRCEKNSFCEGGSKAYICIQNKMIFSSGRNSTGLKITRKNQHWVGRQYC